MKEEQLIFLISQPRSGSTLTQKILGAHSKIYTRSEPWLMLQPAYSLKNSGITAEYEFEAERKAFNSFVEGLPEGKKTYIDALRSMYLGLYSSYLGNKNDDYFLDKTPRYYLITDELLQIFPRAKYILLIRDPLAVLCSIVKTWTNENWFNLSIYKHDLLTAIDRNIDVIDSKHNEYKIIHYEELIKGDEKYLNNIFDYLGVGYEKEVLNYHKDNDDRWIYGDKERIYENKGIDRNNDTKWVANLKKPQYWRAVYDYLNYIGEEKYHKLGYDYNQTIGIVNNAMPADTLDEILSNTFPLFSLLNNTREDLIENQKQQQTIIQKNQQIKDQKTLIGQRDKKINEYKNTLDSIYKSRSYRFSALLSKINPF